MTIRAILLLTLAMGVGCKKSEESSGAGSAAPAPTAPAMAHRAGNCPSTVAHSTTTAAIADKDVVVTITSADPAAVEAIQKRTDELLAARSEHKDGASREHTHDGRHGGSMGLCPIYLPEGATTKATRQPDGVAVAITVADPAALKTEVDARIKRSADWVTANVPAGEKGTQAGTGGGDNHEGMNHSGQGDGKGRERKGGDGQGGGGGTGGGGGKGTGGGGGSGSAP